MAKSVPINPADEFSDRSDVRAAFFKATDAERSAQFFAIHTAEPWASEFASLALSFAGKRSTPAMKRLVFGVLDLWRASTGLPRQQSAIEQDDKIAALHAEFDAACDSQEAA